MSKECFTNFPDSLRPCPIFLPLFAKSFREKRRNFAKTMPLFAKMFVFVKSQKCCFVPTLLYTDSRFLKSASPNRPATTNFKNLLSKLAVLDPDS
jgi:hypothetical protein